MRFRKKKKVKIGTRRRLVVLVIDHLWKYICTYICMYVVLMSNFQSAWIEWYTNADPLRLWSLMTFLTCFSWNFNFSYLENFSHKKLTMASIETYGESIRRNWNQPTAINDPIILRTFPTDLPFGKNDPHDISPTTFIYFRKFRQRLYSTERKFQNLF